MNPPSLITISGDLVTVNDALPPEILTQILLDVELSKLVGLLRNVCKLWKAILDLAQRKPTISLRCISQRCKTAAWSIREVSISNAFRPSPLGAQPLVPIWRNALVEGAGFHAGEIMQELFSDPFILLEIIRTILSRFSPSTLPEDPGRIFLAGMIRGAIMGGRTEVLDQLLLWFGAAFMGFFDNSITGAEKWTAAASRGRTQVLDWIEGNMERLRGRTQRPRECAQVVLGAQQDGHRLFSAPVIMLEAAMGGQLTAVQWLRVLFDPPFPWPDDFVQTAAGSGNKDLVRWLATSYAWNEFTVCEYCRSMKIAASRGDVGMLLLLTEVVQHHCTFDDITFRRGYVYAANYAAIHGHVDVLRWVRECVGGPFHEALPEFNTMAHIVGRTALVENAVPTPYQKLEKYQDVCVANDDVDRFLLEEHALCLLAKHQRVFKVLFCAEPSCGKKRKRAEEED
ncbi:hypothetical protein QOT17_019717 [Balamuthia mandrillaris]